MKIRNLIIISFLTLSIFLGVISTSTYVNAYIGIYEKRTNPLNPFVFTTDIIYVPSGENLTTTNIETFYHQVYLQSNKYYLLYIVGGPVSNDNWEFDFHYLADNSIDNYVEYFSLTTGILYLLLLKPTITGYFNFTMIGGTLGHYTVLGFYGIGFLELPDMNLGDYFAYDYWDFNGNIIVAGKLTLNAGNYIVASDEGGMTYFPYSIVYYENLNSVNQFERLSENVYPQLNCSLGYKTYFTAGDYIFFSLNGDEFGLMNAPSQEPLISGYPLFLLGLISMISIIIIIKKFRK
ncbi:MAG: hypothetical protein ACFFDH_24890 [Promethearchaeota archaeon]